MVHAKPSSMPEAFAVHCFNEVGFLEVDECRSPLGFESGVLDTAIGGGGLADELWKTAIAVSEAE